MAKVLSIEISNSLIRICEMDYKKKNPRVYRQAMVPTPPGAISDGYLNGIDDLRTAIRRALNDNQMKTKEVIFTIASSKIVNREVMLPAVKKPSMLGTMIRNNLNEYFPIDLSSYEIAHQILEQMSEGPEAGKYRTMIMAAEKSLVDGYDKLATLCGLRLVSLDYAGNSMFQAIKNEDTAARIMLLKIEETQTMVSIVKNKSLMLQRTINYGLAEGINEVTKQAVFNADNYDAAWELLKNKTCIKFNVSEVAQRNSRNQDLSTDIETRDYDENQEIREAKIEVTKSLDPLISAIRRVTEFYASRNAGEEVDRIIVTGFGGAMSGLAKLLTNELGIKTQVLNRMEGVAYLVTSDDAKIFNFVSCIGATFNPVGFISKETKSKSKKEMDYTLWTIVVIVLAIWAVAALLLISYSKYKEQVTREADLKEKEQAYLKAEQTYKEHQSMLKLYEEVRKGEAMLKRPNDNILLFFKELEETLPADVEVTMLDSDDQRIIITMKVGDKETAANVIAKFREFKSIMMVTTPTIKEAYDVKKDEEGNDLFVEGEEPEVELSVVEPYVEFTITADYYPVDWKPEVEEEK